MILSQGLRLERYEILTLLGAGGMGEVYLAFDSVLGRKVALKRILPHFGQDRDRFQRFAREARAISRLNHPNVITIYDVLELNDQHFIATEFIEGETLSQMLSRSRPQLTKAIELAIQISTALAAAHEAGVVHRDIKPKNIMIRPDGVVKVLDFGLSKLMQCESAARSESSTLESITTQHGAVLGTLAYMAPEQLRGLDVDARADIFSLGVVLYEMVAGCAPFQRPTANDLIAAVLTAEPPCLSSLAPTAPSALCRITDRALRKDPCERYQTVPDLLVDLKALRPQLEWGGGLGHADSMEEGKMPRDSAGESGHPTGRNIRIRLAWAMLAIALAAGGFGLFHFYGPGSRTGTFQAMRIEKISSNGRAGFQTAISPDGQHIAYVAVEAAGQGMRLRHVPSGSDVLLAAPSATKIHGITFAPDGNSIRYVARDAAGVPTLYQMPVLGGSSKKLLSGVDGPVSFSPDGKQFVFVRRGRSLMTARSDGQGDRELASCGMDEFWRYPSWSPDGRIIACGVGSSTAARDYLVAINARDAARKTIPSPQWTRIYSIAWLPEGKGLVVNALEDGAKSPQLWILSYPGGQLRRITNDLNSYYGASLTADSKRLACVQGERLSNIWLAPISGASRGIRITSGVGKDEGIAGITWTPDDRIVFVSRISGRYDLWIMSSDGSNQRQLTENAGNNYYPAVSADGRSIAFISDRAGKNDIWRMDIDGASSRPLTYSGGANRPQWSRDGLWIVYEARNGSESLLRKVSSEGGDSMPLTREGARTPALSPDGKRVAFYSSQGQPGSPPKIATVPLNGGPPEVLFTHLPFARPMPFRWSPDGLSLAFIDDRTGSFDIWNLPVGSGSTRRMTDLRMASIFDFDWSRDGRRLACACGEETSDVILISNFP